MKTYILHITYHRPLKIKSPIIKAKLDHIRAAIKRFGNFLIAGPKRWSSGMQFVLMQHLHLRHDEVCHCFTITGI